MDRLFLDANVLFSAAYRPDAGVARLWRLAGVALLTSEYAVVEARRNLTTPARVDRLTRLVEPLEVVRSGTLDPGLRAGVELPEKDWPILGGAIQAGATHLITGDAKHFGPYFGRIVLGVLVLTPGAYLAS